MRPHPKVLIHRAVGLYGMDEVVQWAASLLSGQPAGDDPDISLLGGSPGWAPYWSRVWGARAFLYVWEESASAAVIHGLGDEHWRVREMCAKVYRRRELADGAAALALLAGDPVTRVRVSAYNAIADICEADSADPCWPRGSKTPGRPTRPRPPSGAWSNDWTAGSAEPKRWRLW